MPLPAPTPTPPHHFVHPPPIEAEHCAPPACLAHPTRLLTPLPALVAAALAAAQCSPALVATAPGPSCPHAVLSRAYASGVPSCAPAPTPGACSGSPPSEAQGPRRREGGSPLAEGGRQLAEGSAKGVDSVPIGAATVRDATASVLGLALAGRKCVGAGVKAYSVPPSPSCAHGMAPPPELARASSMGPSPYAAAGAAACPLGRKARARVAPQRASGWRGRDRLETDGSLDGSGGSFSSHACAAAAAGPPRDPAAPRPSLEPSSSRESSSNEVSFTGSAAADDSDSPPVPKALRPQDTPAWTSGEVEDDEDDEETGPIVPGCQHQ